MLNFTFNKMVPKLMEVLEDPDKAEKILEVDLMMALSLMVAKVLLFYILNLAFASDLMCKDAHHVRKNKLF